MNCPTCDREIRNALCCEGWCKDCTHSEWTSPIDQWPKLYCKGHRTHVASDEHCKDWMKDEK